MGEDVDLSPGMACAVHSRNVRIAELEAENARLRTVTPAMLAAAWDAWKPRHKDRLGPGPAFREAIEAAIAVAGVPVRGEER